MGSGLTIDNVLGPVFEGEDQQFWIPGLGQASCQMWDVRPDPMFAGFQKMIGIGFAQIIGGDGAIAFLSWWYRNFRRFILHANR
jgi:hypothetical protein